MTTSNGDPFSVADVNLVSLISTSFALFFFFADIDFWHYYLFLVNCASELGFTTPKLSYTAYKRTRGL